MHAYLIDPFARHIVAVDYGGDERKIHCYLDAMHIDITLLNEAGDGMCIDDDGFAKHPAQQAYFLYWQNVDKRIAAPHVLAGKALVVGPLIGGMPAAPTIGISALARRVVWIDTAHAVAHIARITRQQSTCYRVNG